MRQAGEPVGEGRRGSAGGDCRRRVPYATSPLLGLVFFALVALGYGIWLYHNAGREALADLDRRLLMAAKTIPHVLEADFFDRAISPSGISPAEDRRNIQRLTRMANDLGVTYLYTLLFRDGDVYITSSSASPEEIAEGTEVRYYTEYPETLEAVERVVASDGPVFTTYEDRWGVFRHAYVSGTSAAGYPYVIAADYDIGTIHSMLRRRTAKAVFATVLLLAATVPFVLSYRRRQREHLAEPRSVNEALQEDIRRRKETEKENRRLEMHMRQAQKLESIGTLASGVAHEINNPINGIMNYAQLILDEPDAGEVIGEFAGEIIHETKRVAAIVRSLLDFARHKDGIRHPTQMAAIVDATLSVTRTLFRHDQITLEVDVPEELPPVCCRRQEIQQVIMNLVTNARDALNAKYPGYHENKKISIQGRWVDGSGEDYVRLTVIDRGVGIPKAAQENVFDPFFTTKLPEKGTGLGLSISHRIVQDHGGRLSVESCEGEWTAFHLDLPPAADDPEARGPTAAEDATRS